MSQTLMIAHRGLSSIEPENTAAAFIAAGNRNFYGIETDVHTTSDGKYIAIHDGVTGRVADVDLEVSKTSLNELRKIILKDKNGSSQCAHLRIPTLEEFVSICKRYGKKAVVELKGGYNDAQISEIIGIISRENYLQNTIFISFWLENLLRLRKVLPYQKMQFLTNKYDADIGKMLKKNKLDLDISYKELTQDIVTELKSHKIEVNCFTVDKKTDAQRLAKWGVDYITTNTLCSADF